MYIYEYDWSPDGRSFAVSAAHGMGDNNWWIAQIYTLPAAGGELKAGLQTRRRAADRRAALVARRQIDPLHRRHHERRRLDRRRNLSASPPRGGDAAQHHAGHRTRRWPISPRPRIRSTSTSASTSTAAAPSRRSTPPPARPSASGRATKPSSPWMAAACRSPTTARSTAVTRNSWQRAPEVWAGPVGDWRKLTHANEDRLPLWGEAKSLHWKSDEFTVQGWLHLPQELRPAKKYPMVVSVHGGPASSMKPAWPRPGFNATLLSQQGYFVLLPESARQLRPGREVHRGQREGFRRRRSARHPGRR